MIKRMMLIAMLLALVVMLCGSRGVSPKPYPRSGTSASAGTSGDAILLETGDYLLLESGDYVLTE